MEFRELLKKDLDRVGCSLSDLSRASGLSSAVISRYRSGERIPRPNSEMLQKLCDGFAKLEAEAGIAPLGEEHLLRYRAVIGNKPSLLSEHLDELLKTLRLSMKDLSYLLNYDASYLSRIRSGKRTPADPVAFADHMARSLNESLRPSDRLLVAGLTGAKEDADFVPALSVWLIQSGMGEENSIEHFLNSISSFDLNQYIRSISISPETFRARTVRPEEGMKLYYDVEGSRQAELDFFMTVLQSDSPGPIYMYNDMPMEEMTKDVDFVKQWMELIARCLKKGCHIHIIHNVYRPFIEMMLGLETWIPIYMTGQVHPYYLTSQENTVFRHCVYVSDACALQKEGIGNSLENSAAVLSAAPDHITYVKNRAKQLFSHASPLMKITRGVQNEAQINAFKTEYAVPGVWNIRACVPPFSTLNEKLLDRILDENHAGEDLRRRARAFLYSQKEFLDRILQNGTCSIEILVPSKKEFEEYTPEFDAPFLHSDESLSYSWETYLEHLSLSKEFAAGNAGLSVRQTDSSAFRNLSIYVRDQKAAIVARQKNPRIIFFITHPNMVRAISQFTAPVVDPAL